MLLTDEIKKIATELVSRDGVMIFSLPYYILL